MTRAYIALGANLPFEGVEGPALLSRALAALRDANLPLHTQSSVWQTEAWPQGSGQPDYYNAVVEVDAGALTPQGLYDALAGIERRFGRVRRERWAPRTLDLDIIDMEGHRGSYGGIQLPHPRMRERAFVLAPLAEIAPDWRHPESNLAAADLLTRLSPGDRYEKQGPIPLF